MLNRIPVALKVFIAPFAIIVMMVATIIASQLVLRRQQDAFLQVVGGSFKISTTTTKLLLAIAEVHSDVMRYAQLRQRIPTGDPVLVNMAHSIEESYARIDRLFQEIKTSGVGEPDAVGNISDFLTIHRAVARRMLIAETVSTTMISTLLAHYQQLQSYVVELASRTLATAQATEARASKQVADVSRYLLIGAAGCIAISILLAFQLGRAISKPITAMVVTLKQIVDGNLAVSVSDVERRDEIGSMARAVEVFAAVSRELRQREQSLSVALAQQTATAEILRVISQSPTDVQPVFDTIADRAMRLCDAGRGAVLIRDGECLHLRALATVDPGGGDTRPRAVSIPLSQESAAARALVTGDVVHDADVLSDRESTDGAQAIGYRSILAVPMLHHEGVIGVVVVKRREPGVFSPEQIRLLKTFADQAVIAVDNVRLFKELQARTAQLTRSVEELTALGDVGRAVSSTLDVETVLNTIVTRANQLAGTDACSVYEYDEQAEVFHIRATNHLDDQVIGLARQRPIAKGEGVLGRMAVSREPLQVPDIAAEQAYRGPLRDVLLRTGTRALLAVPLLREDHLVGGLTINRKAPGTFAPELVELLKTFATQSAIAIQNAQLFRELEAKSRQLEVASRHKSDFLANVSHELRTPMNAILGFNEMILGGIYGPVSEKLKVPLNDIQNSGRHLLRLINTVLDLSKIEAGRMELALADYSVQDIVEGVRAQLHSLSAQKGVDLVTAVPADIPLAHGDAGRITQCLMNLAGNALKFTRQGLVEISAALHGEWLRYRVSDTGIGIAPDRLEAVFGEFRQGDATIASEFGGTGLGLSITKKFVELHGGRIWVESTLGKGSTFFFAIPLRVELAKTA